MVVVFLSLLFSSVFMYALNFTLLQPEILYMGAGSWHLGSGIWDSHNHQLAILFQPSWQSEGLVRCPTFWILLIFLSAQTQVQIVEHLLKKLHPEFSFHIITDGTNSKTLGESFQCHSGSRTSLWLSASSPRDYGLTYIGPGAQVHPKGRPPWIKTHQQHHSYRVRQ